MTTREDVKDLEEALGALLNSKPKREEFSNSLDIICMLGGLDIRRIRLIGERKKSAYYCAYSGYLSRDANGWLFRRRGWFVANSESYGMVKKLLELHAAPGEDALEILRAQGYPRENIRAFLSRTVLVDDRDKIEVPIVKLNEQQYGLLMQMYGYPHSHAFFERGICIRGGER